MLWWGIMKAVILTAGFSTRLRPLTNNISKSLLPLYGKKKIIDEQLENIFSTNSISTIYIATNKKFYKDFERWKKDRQEKNRIVICSNGIEEESKLKGPFGDLEFFIQNNAINDDLLVLGSDNLFEDPFSSIISFYNLVKAPVVAIGTIENSNCLRQPNDILIDGQTKRIKLFRHKAKPPYQSPYFASFLFILPPAAFPFLGQYLHEMSYSPDPPEHFVGWMVKKGHSFFAYKIRGERLDTGDLASYRSAQEWYKKRN